MESHGQDFKWHVNIFKLSLNKLKHIIDRKLDRHTYKFLPAQS